VTFVTRARRIFVAIQTILSGPAAFDTVFVNSAFGERNGCIRRRTPCAASDPVNSRLLPRQCDGVPRGPKSQTANGFLAMPSGPRDSIAARYNRHPRALRPVEGLAGLALILPLAACSVGPNFVTPTASVESRWKDAGFPAIKTSREDYQRWWASFRDPALNRLVDIAYDQNLTLMEAGARVIEARAALGQAIGEFYPQTQQLSGAADYLQVSKTDATSNPDNLISKRQFWRLNLGAQAAWELDLWGKFRHGVEAADAAYLASIATYDDVLVTLIGDVSSDYIEIRTLQAQIAIARANVVKQREALEIARDRYKGGATSELDVFQAQNVLAQTEAAIPQLTAQLQQTENALASSSARRRPRSTACSGVRKAFPRRRAISEPAFRPTCCAAVRTSVGRSSRRRRRAPRSASPPPTSGRPSRSAARLGRWSQRPTATKPTSSSLGRASPTPSAHPSAGRCSTMARSPIRCVLRTPSCRPC
jgi:hypothetical protein